MCFLPKSRASIDHAPGPSIANVRPSIASMIGINGSPTQRHAIQTSTIPNSTPAAGVHKPARRNIPATAPITCGAADWSSGASPLSTMAE